MLTGYDFEDLMIFFQDFATQLTWDTGEIPCLFSYKSDPLAFQAGGRNISAVIRSDQLGDLVVGTVVTINDSSYTVVEISPIQDGQLTKLMLEE